MYYRKRMRLYREALAFRSLYKVRTAWSGEILQDRLERFSRLPHQDSRYRRLRQRAITL